jgi:hypothetical protein
MNDQTRSDALSAQQRCSIAKMGERMTAAGQVTLVFCGAELPSMVGVFWGPPIRSCFSFSHTRR